jgi:metal-responsive CopG/Arc/MetJ family transcriptional regulator
MEKVLVSIPDTLVNRFRALIPARQRSKVIAYLIETEVEKREKALYECACALEKDEALNKEMSDWNATLMDGLQDETR